MRRSVRGTNNPLAGYTERQDYADKPRNGPIAERSKTMGPVRTALLALFVWPTLSLGLLLVSTLAAISITTCFSTVAPG